MKELHLSLKIVHAQLSSLFVLLRYVPSQQLWSWQDGQFTLPHFFLGKLEQAVNQYFVHTVLYTFACNWQQPFLNDSAERRRMAVEIISWSISMKVWDWAGIKLATPELQSDTHLLPDTLPTALRGPVYYFVFANGESSGEIGQMHNFILALAAHQACASFNPLCTNGFFLGHRL